MDELAGPVPEIPRGCDQMLTEGRGFWDDVNCWYLPEDLVFAARREEIDCVRFEGVCEILPVQECRDTGIKLLDLCWLDRQVCGHDTQEHLIAVECKRVQN